MHAGGNGELGESAAHHEGDGIHIYQRLGKINFGDFTALVEWRASQMGDMIKCDIGQIGATVKSESVNNFHILEVDRHQSITLAKTLWAHIAAIVIEIHRGKPCAVGERPRVENLQVLGQCDGGDIL